MGIKRSERQRGFTALVGRELVYSFLSQVLHESVRYAHTHSYLMVLSHVITSLSLFKLGIEAGFYFTFLFKDLCFVKWVLL